jgi:hypothetical protein
MKEGEELLNYGYTKVLGMRELSSSENLLLCIKLSDPATPHITAMIL